MTAPLLVDEDFPAPAMGQLRARGWDVVSIAEGNRGLTDPEVMALTRQAGRWLVTFDTDFGALVFEQRLPPPPLILLLRVPSYRPRDPAAWVETLFSAGELRVGAFHVFDGLSIRRRPFLAP